MGTRILTGRDCSSIAGARSARPPADGAAQPGPAASAARSRIGTTAGWLEARPKPAFLTRVRSEGAQVGEMTRDSDSLVGNAG
jgi:hypothetical protein